MDPVEAAKKYFDTGKVMQLGTLRDGQPRVNSVYYVPADDYRSVYWMSEPKRRHSEDIQKEPRAAGAIAIKTGWPVIGLQFVGMASEVTQINEISGVIEKYNVKYENVAKGFVERFKAGSNQHSLYRLDMTTIELFDQQNFAGDPIEIYLS